MNVAVREPGAAQGLRRGVLVYRDRIAPRSEAQFLRRQYVGFRRLVPHWVGCRTDEGLPDLGVQPLMIGRPGLLGAWDRVQFKQLGILPPEPDLRALQPAIVHAQFGRGGALALPIARALRIPLVVTFHGGDATKEKHYAIGVLPTVFRRRLEALKREAALFVCVSQFIHDTLAERGFPREKLRVIRLGVEPPAGGSPRHVEASPQISFVGRFVEKKGIGHLIEAVRQLALQGNPVRLVLIGDGPLLGKLKEQAQGLPQVTFTGWLPNHEVREHVRRSMALCAPSVTSQNGDTDGLPTVILEAMSDGVPVIGSQVAGIGEAVLHGASGLLVPPASAEALAGAIQQMLQRPEWRNELGAGARRLARESFNAHEQSRLLEETLMEIAREHEARV